MSKNEAQSGFGALAREGFVGECELGGEGDPHLYFVLTQDGLVVRCRHDPPHEGRW